jgi:cytoskeletal protein CcmA (bactofilin family)
MAKIANTFIFDAFRAANINSNISNIAITGGNAGQFLQTDGNGNLTWANSSPQGSNTQIQFNDNGAFGGSAAFTFNKSSNTVYIGEVLTANTLIGRNGFTANGNSTINGNLSGIQLLSAQSANINGTLNVGTINSTGNLTVTGIANLASNLIVNANVSANYFLGNGRFLTGLVTTDQLYSNANVANYLPTYSGNIGAGNITFAGSSNLTILSTGNIILSPSTSVTVAGNLIVTGNITAKNANNTVQFNLGGNLAGSNAFTFDNTSNSLIIGSDSVNRVILYGTGTITAQSLNLNNDAIISGNANIANNINVTGNVNVTGNLTAKGSNTQLQFNRDGNLSASSRLTFDTATNVLSLLGNANISNNINVIGNLTAKGSNTQLQFNNQGNLAGASQLTFDATANTLTLNTNINLNSINANGNIYTTGNITGNYIFGNITSAGGYNPYSNANVAAYLPTYTGNISAGNITNTGNITTNGNIVANTFVGLSDITLTANGNILLQPTNRLTVSSNTAVNANVTANYYLGNGRFLTGLVTSDQLYSNVNVAAYLAIANIPILANVLTVTGPANIAGNTTITGNLRVTGNTTFINTQDLNVTDKNITIANGAATPSDANGGGITIDGANASLLYYNLSNSLVFNHTIEAPQANLTNLQVTGNIPARGSNTSVQYNLDGNLAGGNAFTFNQTSNALTVSGNINTLQDLLVLGNIPARGASNQLQYNLNGNLAGIPSLTYDSTTATLTLGGNANVFNLNSTFSINGNSLNISNNGTITGNLQSNNTTVINNALVGGNVTANRFVGSNSGNMVLLSTSNILLQPTSNSGAGIVAVTGNISANYLLGNGSQITGIFRTILTRSGNINIYN